MDIPEKFKQLMENEMNDDSENISQTFICCVCRDLLYKPVVLACGHVSCFWCVHRSMSLIHKSRCPICRNQYYHFPSVCLTLHFLLLKLYPLAYKKREKQTIEEETAMGFFSPQFDAPTGQLQPQQTRLQPKDASFNSLTVNTGGTSETIEPVESSSVHQEIGPNARHNNNDIARAGVIAFDKGEVSVADVLCGSCNYMLFRPVVLNCGHVFCSSCTVLQQDKIVKCEVCRSPHPGGIPKVCLEFERFLEEQFPKEYAHRRATSQMSQVQSPGETSGSPEAGNKNTSSLPAGQDPLPWWDGNSSVHTGVGCDCCGMYPIVGNRYRCKDCVEKIGYDLCKDCHDTRYEIPGRFNQQHTSEHEFEVITSNALEILMEQIQNISAISAALRDANIDITIINETNEDAHDVLDAPFSSSERDESQSDDEAFHERVL